MDLVDEHDGAGKLLDLLEDLLQPLLEIAAVTGAGQQRPHVEGKDGCIPEHLGNLAFDNALGEPLRDRRLADARFPDEQRIVLLTAAEDLDRPVDLAVTPDERVDFSFPRLLVQIDAIGLERVGFLLDILAPLNGGSVFIDPSHRSRLRHSGPLGDAVADVVDRVVTGHVLLLQEISRMALALREDRHQHVRACHFLAAGRLHVDDRALDDPLESGGGFGVFLRSGGQIGQFGVDVFDEVSADHIEINAAGTHDSGRVLVIDQRQQQVLQRRVFLISLAGVGQRLMQSLLKAA